MQNELLSMYKHKLLHVSPIMIKLSTAVDEACIDILASTISMLEDGLFDCSQALMDAAIT
jgi:hypothetical protein